TLVVNGFLAVRLWRASPRARRPIAPLYPQWFVFWNFAVFYHSLGAILGGGPMFCATRVYRYMHMSYPLGVGGAAVVGAGRGRGLVRRAGSAVADLVVELGRVEPGGVRDALARALGDPNLTLGLWLPDRGIWADEQGNEIEVPDDGERGVTYIGEALAVLVHD